MLVSQGVTRGWRKKMKHVWLGTIVGWVISMKFLKELVCEWRQNILKRVVLVCGDKSWSRSQIVKGDSRANVSQHGVVWWRNKRKLTTCNTQCRSKEQLLVQRHRQRVAPITGTKQRDIWINMKKPEVEKFWEYVGMWLYIWRKFNRFNSYYSY